MQKIFRMTFLLLSLLVISVSSYADLNKQNPKQVRKDNTLTVIISKPLNEVFEFAMNPHETPKWVDGVKVEEANEWPPRVGTVYKSRGETGPWNVLTVSKYEKDKEFEFVKPGSPYHVKCTLTTLPNGATKLVYHEWVTSGNLDSPTPQALLDKLKTVMEKS